MVWRRTVADSVVFTPMPDLRRAGALVRLLIPLGVLSANGAAHAACIESSEPAVRALQALAASDPNRAIARADAMLVKAGKIHAPAQHVAWLHAVRAQAYSLLELDAD